MTVIVLCSSLTLSSTRSTLQLFSNDYGIQRFTPVCTIAQHMTMSWTHAILFATSQLISYKSIVVTPHSHVALPSGISFEVCQPNFCENWWFSLYMPYGLPIMSFYLILTVLDKEYRSWRSLECNFYVLFFLFYFIGKNILYRIFFSSSFLMKYGGRSKRMEGEE
jgi:hypothetical protein